MTEKMRFEEYKKNIEESLIELGGKANAEFSMKLYEKDLQELYEDGWDIPTAVAAIRSGY